MHVMCQFLQQRTNEVIKPDKGTLYNEEYRDLGTIICAVLKSASVHLERMQTEYYSKRCLLSNNISVSIFDFID